MRRRFGRESRQSSRSRLTRGGFGVAGSDSAQRAGNQKDLVDVERVAAEKLRPVAVGLLHT